MEKQTTQELVTLDARSSKAFHLLSRLADIRRDTAAFLYSPECREIDEAQKIITICTLQDVIDDMENVLTVCVYPLFDKESTEKRRAARAEYIKNLTGDE